MKFELVNEEFTLREDAASYKVIGKDIDKTTTCSIKKREFDSEIDICSHNWNKEEIVKEFCKFVKVPFEKLKQVHPKENPYWRFYKFNSKLFKWKEFQIKMAPFIEKNRIEALHYKLEEISTEDLKKVIEWRKNESV